MRGCVWPCGRLQPLIGDRRSPHTRGFALAGASARVEHPQALAGSLSVCLSVTQLACSGGLSVLGTQTEAYAVCYLLILC